MQTHQSSPTPATLGDLARVIATTTDTAVTTADRLHGDAADDGLAAAAVLLRAVDRIIAAVITVLQAAGHREVIAAHGVTPDSWLRAVAGRTGGDAGMLLAAAERLADMPAVTAWFHQGTLSWGSVRAIVAATRNLTAAQRAWVDATLAGHGDDVARLDGDQVAATVEGLANRARPKLARDREAAAPRGRWLSIQPRLDGTAAIHGSLDPETAAAALAAFTTTPTPDHHHDGDDDPDGGGCDGCDSDDGDGDDGGGDGWGGVSDADAVRAARRQANVDVFGDLCRQRLTHRHQHNTDGDDGANLPGDTDGTDITDGTTDPVGPAAGRRRGRCGSAPSAARPAFLVVADLAALDADAPVGSGTARLHWATNRAPVELTAAAARRLACDATLRVVLTDGTEVLGVTAAHPKVSATLRAALVVRDGGCRFPACTQPAELCDAHHLIPVAAGGTTVLENLALLCRQHHHAIHDGGWQATMHAGATTTFTRRQITLTSIPRVSQHPRAAIPPPGGRPRRQHAVTRTATPPPDAGAGPDPADALLPF